MGRFWGQGGLPGVVCGLWEVLGSSACWPAERGSWGMYKGPGVHWCLWGGHLWRSRRGHWGVCSWLGGWRGIWESLLGL